jgi:hypothetical protein
VSLVLYFQLHLFLLVLSFLLSSSSRVCLDKYLSFTLRLLVCFSVDG